MGIRVVVVVSSAFAISNHCSLSILSLLKILMLRRLRIEGEQRFHTAESPSTRWSYIVNRDRNRSGKSISTGLPKDESTTCYQAQL